MQASDIAWQPFTPGGVAAFARARLINLLTVQLITALVIAGAVLWFIFSAWLPVIDSAVHQLPPGGSVRHGRFTWQGASPVVLAENRFLALTVDLEHLGQVRSPAHVQVEFGMANIRIFSLFGMIQTPYPRGWIIAVNREELAPWWGAWSPVLLALAGAGVALWLFLNWFALSTLYCPVAWLVGFFADRELTLRSAWRLSGAALLPGAFFLCAAIALYGLGALDVVRLLVATVAHLLIGWGYLIASPFWCPRHSCAILVKGNPFTAQASVQPPGQGGQPGGEQPLTRQNPENKNGHSGT